MALPPPPPKPSGVPVPPPMPPQPSAPIAPPLPTVPKNLEPTDDEKQTIIDTTDEDEETYHNELNNSQYDVGDEEAEEDEEYKPPKLSRKERIKQYAREVKERYHIIELAVIVGLAFGASFGYYYVLTDAIIMSIIIGILGAFFFFDQFSFRMRRLVAYQEQLQTLLKYVTNMKFFMTTGENIMRSIQKTNETIGNDQVEKDLQIMIDKLNEDAILYTKQFEKYDFPTLRQFHQNLQIAYDRGGDTEELFGIVQKNMLKELEKRDDLFKKRKAVGTKIMMLLILVMSMPLILRFMVTSEWMLFIQYELTSHIILIITMLAFVWVMRDMQKHKMDISVRI